MLRIMKKSSNPFKKAAKLNRKQVRLTRALHDALDRHVIESLVPEIMAENPAKAIEALKKHVQLEATSFATNTSLRT